MTASLERGEFSTDLADDNMLPLSLQIIMVHHNLHLWVSKNFRT